MKKPPTPKPLNPKLLSVTIREIEFAGPCSGKYLEFLREFRSKPVSDGSYASYRLATASAPKTPRYGPDDPIPLRLIADSGDGNYRISWLLGHLERLNPLMDKVDRQISREMLLLNKQAIEIQAKIDRLDRATFLIEQLPPVAKPKKQTPLMGTRSHQRGSGPKGTRLP